MIDCVACELSNGRRALPGGLIHRSTLWLVEHCIGPLGLGTLIVKPERHLTSVADLSRGRGHRAWTPSMAYVAWERLPAGLHPEPHERADGGRAKRLMAHRRYCDRSSGIFARRRYAWHPGRAWGRLANATSHRIGADQSANRGRQAPPRIQQNPPPTTARSMRRGHAPHGCSIPPTDLHTSWRGIRGTNGLWFYPRQGSLSFPRGS